MSESMDLRCITVGSPTVAYYCQALLPTALNPLGHVQLL